MESSRDYRAEWGKGGGWGLNKRCKNNPKHGTNRAREDWSTHLLQGCRGLTSKKLSFCSSEWDPGREFDYLCQWPALVGEGTGGEAQGVALILGSGRDTVKECAKL